MPVRRNQLQRQFHSFIAVAAHSLDGQKTRNDHVAVEFGHLSAFLTRQDYASALARQLQRRFDRLRSARRAVHHQVGHVAAGEGGDGFEQVFAFDIDGVMGAQFSRQGQAKLVGIARQAGHDDPRRAGLARSNDAGQPLLPRTLNDNALARPRAAVQIGPLDAIGQRQRQRGMPGLHPQRHPVENGVQMQMLVLAEAAPEARRDLQRGRAVAQAAQAPVGGVAQAKLAAAAIVAVAARQVLLERHQVAFLDAPFQCRHIAQRFHMADGFMAEDQRAAACRQLLVVGGVAAADAGDGDAQQPRCGARRGFVERLHFGAP